MTVESDPERQSEQQSVETQLRRRVRELEELVGRQEETINLFYTLFYASPIPISISRYEDGRCLYVNDTFLRYFGWEREEVVGRTDLELGFWRDEAQRQTCVERVRREGQITREGRIAPSQSREGPHHAVSSISYVETESDAFIISAYVDVTERVVAESQVEQLASALLRAEHQERKRVAQLLHDDIQQLLYSVQLELQSVAEHSDSEIAPELRAMEQRMATAIDAARTLSFELNAVALESRQLEDLLDWLTLVKANRYGLKLDVHQARPVVIEDRARRQLLLKVLRELLFNVVKHAGVNEARLTADVQADILHVEISDAGVGFDPTELREAEGDTSGSGLSTIEERLRFFGGTLNIDSRPGAGTRCEVILPLPS